MCCVNSASEHFYLSSLFHLNVVPPVNGGLYVNVAPTDYIYSALCGIFHIFHILLNFVENFNYTLYSFISIQCEFHFRIITSTTILNGTLSIYHLLLILQHIPHLIINYSINLVVFPAQICFT